MLRIIALTATVFFLLASSAAAEPGDHGFPGEGNTRASKKDKKITLRTARYVHSLSSEVWKKTEAEVVDALVCTGDVYGEIPGNSSILPVMQLFTLSRAAADAIHVSGGSTAIEEADSVRANINRALKQNSRRVKSKTLKSILRSYKQTARPRFFPFTDAASYCDAIEGWASAGYPDISSYFKLTDRQTAGLGLINDTLETIQYKLGYSRLSYLVKPLRSNIPYIESYQAGNAYWLQLTGEDVYEVEGLL